MPPIVLRVCSAGWRRWGARISGRLRAVELEAIYREHAPAIVASLAKAQQYPLQLSIEPTDDGDE